MTALPLALKPPFANRGGFCWSAELPAELAWAGDDNHRPKLSPLALMEDDTVLPTAHALHAEIQEKGDGRYSFWRGTLYFSSSDNTDPNTNGRAYGVEVADQTRRSDTPRTIKRDFATPPVRPVALRLGVAGLGLRGRSLARHLAALPGDIQIAAVHDPSAVRVEDFARTVMGGKAFETHGSYGELVEDRTLDAVVIASPDHLHVEHAVRALTAGKALFLEKPVATTLAGAEEILTVAERVGRPVHIGFVLRYAPFYLAIRDEILSGVLGDVVGLDLAEHLAIDHAASYRRRWHRRAEWSGGLIVHKGCHDIDLIPWLTGQDVVTVVSTGGPGLLSRRAAPATHCSLCPENATCRYRFNERTLFVADREREALTEYDMDRCVYALDQDIVEHQALMMELSNGARASFLLDMSEPVRNARRIRVTGERGLLEGVLEDSAFDVTFHDGRAGYRIVVDPGDGGHMGGDQASLAAFIGGLTGDTGDTGGDGALREAVAGLRVALAAEASRRTGRAVRVAADDWG